ncbi:Integrase catalytic region OS=Tsukamurella paurometabola (strain ATCC 8368 / DSM / CCUG 35730/ CIP 100753 / JCM 10117 / KCTC 9821 / NBRC 16120 / NCIMB 702349 / NCTC 13040) OX=521096 GN=Tpau_1024 PE=3 SV=1 [Tsukamurella paurometabola]|uniref:Integrase catalytic region n=1 Tax=Tsukamurella paurometabola (strain ATCC 8368 / DSM 20162 / CCUG 35730 / CIP 100753 / JCM 10117 / KCTC 9821 / NBRC 16120 / NCIMB 702349 / NCTC 13040) TaxID=521096 RepID=D5UV67_TSUPD|nr:Integrase catalytic region [Tsukamurella paurometabola DSM 20162]SUP28152.1 Transposase and inactivated derivatives [Tsukamurella paurometabola]
MEDWAEIRRLHQAEGMPIKVISRQLGVARNTVRAALASDRPPQYQRAPKGSVVDPYEPQIRALLQSWPTMPAPVIAQRIGWPYSLSPLKKRLALLRPEYKGIDPSDRITYEPGKIAQCDLWFPDVKIPVGPGQDRVLPVLVMVLGFSRHISAVMLPSRQGGDLLSGMWQLIEGWGRVPKSLVWDREAAIGGTGKPTVEVAGFAGTLATRIVLAPARDPEFKGIVERANQYLETSFLPGRVFTSPADFNAQMTEWLTQTANRRLVRATGTRPAEAFTTDFAAMTVLPPMAPMAGLRQRIRLGRDYYVRVDGNDYSIDPRVIGKFVDIAATPTQVVAACDGQPVALHRRSWAKHTNVTDPQHVATAQLLRARYQEIGRQASPRQHHDGHPVALRALPDYDALFGVPDFTAPAMKAAAGEEPNQPEPIERQNL